jgi:DNA (cytosine-5)-methyltransferase 1
VGAYYNEIDPLKAAILREAIKADAIAPGDVDERSIVNVSADDLVGYTQCHFFAGGGFWSLALRQAGWPDERQVWTGSCPCPSFSAAGKGQGFSDPRHLWPYWARLIRECHPPTIFGEQVSAAIGHGWLDLVQTDLEAEAYAVGKIVLGAASVGAPHIRQRLYFIAMAVPEGIQSWTGLCDSQPTKKRWNQHSNGNGTGLMANADGGSTSTEREQRGGKQRQQPQDDEAGSVADAGSRQFSFQIGQADQRNGIGPDGANNFRLPNRTSTLNGFWRGADWIGCRDGKFRPVEPGSFPLAHGCSARVGRLRLYGDAICIPAAQAFIKAYLDAEQETMKGTGA